MTGRQVLDSAKSPVAIRRVQQVLRADPNIEYRKLKCAPVLTPAHKEKRLEFSLKYIVERARFWRHIVYSDEKRFCLDGPYGWAYHWHDKRLPVKLLSIRPRQGESVMVWAGVSARSDTEIVFVPNTMDSVKYTEVLGDALMPLIEDKYSRDGDFVYINKTTQLVTLRCILVSG